MYGKSPMMKALIGKQGNLPVALQKKILASDSPMDMYGKSPAKKYDKSPVKKDTGEVVSKNSPGPGWTKTKGTNIWAPPTVKMGYSQKMTKVKRKSTEKNSTITDETKMKPPYKKPVGPRA